MTTAGEPARPMPTVRSALTLLGRHWRQPYLAAVAATAVNTVFDVVRQLLVWDDLGVSAATGRGDTTSSGTPTAVEVVVCINWCPRGDTVHTHTRLRP